MPQYSFLEKNKMKKGIFALLWISIPLTLLLLPIDFIDQGKSICPSKLFFNIECFGCGISRACMHFFHMDFIGAWKFNKLVIIIGPLLILFWIHIFGKILGKSWLKFFKHLYS